MLPDHAGGTFEAVTSGSRATARILSDPNGVYRTKDGRLGFVANVGSLIEPVTRAQYRTGGARLPLQLFWIAALWWVRSPTPGP